MRKRTSTKRKASAVAKAAADKNQKLDQLFHNVGLIRRDWYTEYTHNAMLALLPNKLTAIKALMDISREKDGEGRYGLKQLKDFVDQFTVPTIFRPEPTPFQRPRNIDYLDEVAGMISNEMRSDTPTWMDGLTELLSYVPQHILQRYYEKNNDE